MMDPQFVRAHEPWCFTTSSTPGKRDREAAIYQCELVSDALLALQTIPQTDALQYVLLTIRQILDDGDKYNHSTNSLTFCEGLGFLQIWDYTRIYKHSGELKDIIHKVEICLLERFSQRVHLHLKTLLANQVAQLDVREIYLKFCKNQLLPSEWTRDLRSRVLTSHSKNFDDSTSLFLPKRSRKSKRSLRRNGSPARPPRRPTFAVLPTVAGRSLSAPPCRRHSADQVLANDDTEPLYVNVMLHI